MRYPFWDADVAQLVEHQLPKLRVAGSNPVVRFTKACRAACHLADLVTFCPFQRADSVPFPPPGFGAVPVEEATGRPVRGISA